ncbi:MAG TPA: PKD domain-containing protein [Candidatus Thermoplasmatota archaeon]|nr:PKD domain-containing protein [Candidatus Thermoplasmatota archaeon]
MRLSALLASLTLVAILFAGCSGGDGDGDATTSSSSSSSASASSTGSSTSRSSTASSTGSASSTSTGSSAENKAPTGSVSAAINGTNATFTLTGADPDDDSLVWELEFGDGAKANGTSLPASITHEYPASANYTANYTVTDGQDRADYNVTVTITGGGAAVQSASTKWMAASTGCAAEYERIPPAAQAGNRVYGLVEVDPATVGLTYTAVIAWTAGPLALGADVSFYDAAGAFVEGNLVDGGPPVTLTGVVPDGAAFAVFTMCDIVNEASATYVVA